MRLLVIGGAGFIGSNFVRAVALRYPSYEITVFDALTYAGTLEPLAELRDAGRVDFVHADVCDRHAVQEAVARCDAVVNFAAHSHVDRSIQTTRPFHDVNAGGVINILDSLKSLETAGGRRRRFVQVSSVVGDTPVMIRHNGVVQRTQFDQWWADEQLRAELRGAALSSDYIQLDGVTEVLNLDAGHVRFSPVTTLIRHKLTKRLVRVQYAGGDVTVTADHSLFVFGEDGAVHSVPSDEIEEGDLLVTTSGKVSSSAPHNPTLWSLLSSSSAEHLSKIFETRYKYRNLKQTGLNDPFVLEFLGTFLADGCAGQHSNSFGDVSVGAVVITLHRERKTRYLEYIKQFCAAHGYDYTIKEHAAATIQVQISSTELNLLLRDLFLHGGRNKRLHGSWAWALDKEQVWRLLSGYSADAHQIAAGGLRFTTGSRNLAVDLCWLLRLHGVSCTVNHQTAEDIAGRKTPTIDGREIHSNSYWMVTVPEIDLPETVRATGRTPYNQCLPSSFVRSRLLELPRGELRCALRKRGVSKEKLRLLLSRELREAITENDLGYSPVTRVEDLGEVDTWVYDASCGKAESFLAGFSPVLCHNTDEIYGPAPADVWFTEEDRQRPGNPYSASKAAADNYVAAYVNTFGVDACITRCTNNYGPWQYPEKLVAMVITSLIDGQRVPIHGDGKMMRDWIWVDDHVDHIDRVLHRGEPGRIYNAAGFCERSVLDVVERVAVAFGKSMDDVVDRIPDRPGQDRRYAVSPAKAMSTLGWRPGKSFEERLPELVAWYREHEQWWRRIMATDHYREHFKMLRRGA